VRIFLANEDISPIKLEPHIGQMWIPKLKEVTKNKPIVFVNSYKNASLYNFYTGVKTHSYSAVIGRKSHYDLLNFENEILHEDVYAVSKLIKDAPFLIKKNKDTLFGFAIDDYTTFQKVTCIIEEHSLKIEKGKDVDFTFTFTNTYNKNITFKNVKFIGVFQGLKNKILAEVPLSIQDLHDLNANKKIVFKASFKAPEIENKGNITFRVALQFYDLLNGYQGNKVNVKIEN
jgi:hypothetical protein